MISKETILDQIELTPSHIIQLRFRKQLVEDGKVLSSEYHRTALEPGVLLVSQLALVNAHLAAMGWPPVPASATGRIQAVVALEHTPAVIQAHQAQIQAHRNRLR